VTEDIGGLAAEHCGLLPLLLGLPVFLFCLLSLPQEGSNLHTAEAYDDTSHSLIPGQREAIGSFQDPIALCSAVAFFSVRRRLASGGLSSWRATWFNGEKETRVDIQIPYGRNTLWLDVPEENLIAVVRPPEQGEVIQEEETIREALAHPIGTPRLRELARGKRSVAILVSDISRPSPSYRFLPAILDELEGLPPEQVTVIFGLGTHRPHSLEEQRVLVGDTAFHRARVMDFNPADCVFLGTTRRGTPIEIFRPYLEAELKIATGNVEYHYFAGFSGGAKAVMPGICSRLAVERNHSLMVLPGAQAGELEDNPLRQDIEEVGDRVGIDFLFNVVLNERKEIAAAVAGHRREAYMQGVRLYEKLYRCSTPELADILVVSPGGFPKDINFYQAHKALENVRAGVKDGGSILLLACCQEGIGDPVFESWLLRMDEPERMIERIRQHFVLGGHKAASLARLLQRVHVTLCSTLHPGLVRSIGLEPAPSPQEGLRRLWNQHAPRARVLVVPFGQVVRPAGCISS
jgi:nickel-dependent lactate racemase